MQGTLGQAQNRIVVLKRSRSCKCKQLFSKSTQYMEASNAEWGTATWEAKTRRRNNLPESVVSSSLVSVDEELFSGTTWPEFVREVQENLCIYHHITFLYGFCFPPLHYCYYFHLIKYLYREQLLII